jgi:hypothetical protein
VWTGHCVDGPLCGRATRVSVAGQDTGCSDVIERARIEAECVRKINWQLLRLVRALSADSVTQPHRNVPIADGQNQLPVTLAVASHLRPFYQRSQQTVSSSHTETFQSLTDRTSSQPLTPFCTSVYNASNSSGLQRMDDSCGNGALRDNVWLAVGRRT